MGKFVLLHCVCLFLHFVHYFYLHVNHLTFISFFVM